MYEYLYSFYSLYIFFSLFFETLLVIYLYSLHINLDRRLLFLYYYANILYAHNTQNHYYTNHVLSSFVVWVSMFFYKEFHLPNFKYNNFHLNGIRLTVCFMTLLFLKHPSAWTLVIIDISCSINYKMIYVVSSIPFTG